ncbi:O-antigen ligase family protein [Luteibacter sp.]|jgi:O-antigen ligase|uniref:O-antigen ligase family protein n=1 Tax=Luteibacter sp. TaxID=1886636 RepID=UPI002F40FFC9
MTLPVSHSAPSTCVQPAGPSAIETWLTRIVLVGFGWLILGMGIAPAGVSYNPGKLYQYALALTLWLPILALLALRPRRWMDFLREPQMALTALFLAWAGVTLFWSHVPRAADEVGHILTILFFLFAWYRAVGENERVVIRLLWICTISLAVVALVAGIVRGLHPAEDGRLAGFGVMANANLAAGAMGAAVVWLWPLPAPTARMRLLKSAATTLLVVFMLFTFSRSAWAALVVALIVQLLSRGSRRAWLHAGVLAVVAIAATVVGMPLLMERGWSLRPEILTRGWELFVQHPWFGLGQGSPFTLDAGAETLTHAHNMFSQLAIELGLVGFLLWVAIWLVLGWRAWTCRRETMGQVVLGLWVFGSVLVQFDLPHLVDSPRPGWMMTWIPLAISMALVRRPRGAERG